MRVRNYRVCWSVLDLQSPQIELLYSLTPCSRGMRHHSVLSLGRTAPLLLNSRTNSAFSPPSFSILARYSTKAALASTRSRSTRRTRFSSAESRSWTLVVPDVEGATDPTAETAL